MCGVVALASYARARSRVADHAEEEIVAVALLKSGCVIHVEFNVHKAVLSRPYREANLGISTPRLLIGYAKHLS